METLKGKLNQQPNAFLLWTMKASPTLTDNYFLMSGTPKRNFNSIHSNKVYAMGKKKSRVNYIDIFKRLWDDTTPTYLLSLPWSDGCCVVVEGDLTPYLITDVYGTAVSRSASWRRGSVSSRIVMAKVTILSCSRWAAALNIALIWPFVSSWGNSEG